MEDGPLAGLIAVVDLALHFFDGEFCFLFAINIITYRCETTDPLQRRTKCQVEKKRGLTALQSNVSLMTKLTHPATALGILSTALSTGSGNICRTHMAAPMFLTMSEYHSPKSERSNWPQQSAKAYSVMTSTETPGSAACMLNSRPPSSASCKRLQSLSTLS